MNYQKTIKLQTSKKGKRLPRATVKRLPRATVKVELREKEPVSPKLSVDLEPVKRFTELSICCDYKDTHGCEGGGQCLNTVCELFPEIAELQMLLPLWERWHLNGMKPGTRKQDAVLEQHRLKNPDWRYDYDTACHVLRDAGLYIDADYNYGHAWLCELIPDHVIAAIRSITERLAERVKSERD